MRFKHLDLNLLICLDALLAEQNVSRAAQKIALSQSALSHALARLRDFFKDDLLVPVGRRMELTPLAATLAQPVRDTLLQIESLTLMQPSMDPATCERSLSVMASDYSGTLLMGAVAREAARLAPGLRVHVRQMDHQWPELLERGEMDLILLAEPFALEAHPREPLFEDHCVCVAWAGNPDVGGELTLEQFRRMGHVVVEYAGGRVVTMDEIELREMGIRRRVEGVVPNFSQLPHYIVGTHRLATVPLRILRMHGAGLPLKILPAPVPLKPFRVVQQYHRHRALDPVLGWFRDLVRRTAAELDAEQPRV